MDKQQEKEVVYCENSGCGRRIDTSGNQFSHVVISGNVEVQRGTERGVYDNENYVVCNTCTKRMISKFKRRNV